jgi:hypothetical protein
MPCDSFSRSNCSAFKALDLRGIENLNLALFERLFIGNIAAKPIADKT